MSSIFNSIRNDRNLPIAKERLIQFAKTLDRQLVSTDNELELEVFRLTRNKETHEIERVKIAIWVVNVKTNFCDRIGGSSAHDLVSNYLRPFVYFGKYHAKIDNIKTYNN